MLKEFKQFIMRGNVLELAVAVIIAGAFGAIVTSFTNDVLMPVIGLMIGGADFSEMMLVLKEGTANADGVIEGQVAIKYGVLINKIIEFLIVAFAIFLMVKAYNRANPPEEPAPAPSGPSEIDLLKEIRDALKK